MVKE
jgi:hypothetical protein